MCLYTCMRKQATTNLYILSLGEKNVQKLTENLKF